MCVCVCVCVAFVPVEPYLVAFVQCTPSSEGTAWPASLTILAVCLCFMNSLHNHLQQCWVLEMGAGVFLGGPGIQEH